MGQNTVSLDINYSKNLPVVISPRDLFDIYFYGVTTRAADGSSIPDNVYLMYIQAAQAEVERYLGIKLVRQVVEEDHHYHGSDWNNWNVIQTSYPVNSPVSLTGFYGKSNHITVPSNWLISKKSSDELFHRSVWLVPNGQGNLGQNTSFFGGVTPFTMIGGSVNSSVPDYWKLRYITGFNKIPMDLFQVVGTLAACSIFNILGDLTGTLGLSATSISLDGISQSVSASAFPGYKYRIDMYLTFLKDTVPRIRDHYRGILFTNM